MRNELGRVGISTVMFLMFFMILISSLGVIYNLYKVKTFVRNVLIHVCWLSICSVFSLTIFFVIPFFSEEECSLAGVLSRQFELVVTSSGGILTFILRFIDSDFRKKLIARVFKQSKINYSRELQLSTISLLEDQGAAALLREGGKDYVRAIQVPYWKSEGYLVHP